MFDNAYTKIRLTARHAVALTLWGEARGEPYLGRVGVANVIRARVQHDNTTWKKVCFKPNQFSCWNGKDANSRACYELGTRLLAGDTCEEVPAWSDCWALAGLVMQGELDDPTNGADHYMTVEKWTHEPPSWVRGYRPVAQLGRHVFFKLW